VFIETGSDKTGDLLQLHNFRYCVNTYGPTMDFITADGGFDFSSDFQNQELHIGKLLFAQIAYAICLQKSGGSFVLKLFDCFTQLTNDLIALLSSLYERVYITKPNTSRYANSEKYIVCMGFRSSGMFPMMDKLFVQMTSSNVDTFPLRFLSCPLTHYFLTKMEEYNSIFGQQQIDNIHTTLTLIENKDVRYKKKKIDEFIQTHTQKSIHWCIKHNISVH